MAESDAKLSRTEIEIEHGKWLWVNLKVYNIKKKLKR